jgi:hypothetical protein
MCSYIAQCLRGVAVDGSLERETVSFYFTENEIFRETKIIKLQYTSVGFCYFLMRVRTGTEGTEARNVQQESII